MKYAKFMVGEIEADYEAIVKTQPEEAELLDARFDRDYNIQAVYDEIGVRESNKIIFKAKKYGIPLPSHRPNPETDDTSGDDWVLSVYHIYYLSDKAIYDIKVKIREEEKLKREQVAFYTSLVIGVGGLAVGILSQL